MTKPLMLLALGLLLSSVGSRAVADTEPTPTRPALDRCRDFCSELYGTTGNQRDQCDNGCIESETCTHQCKEKFPEDKPKLHKCVRHCMNRSSARVL